MQYRSLSISLNPNPQLNHICCQLTNACMQPLPWFWSLPSQQKPLMLLSLLQLRLEVSPQFNKMMLVLFFRWLSTCYVFSNPKKYFINQYQPYMLLLVHFSFYFTTPLSTLVNKIWQYHLLYPHFYHWLTLHINSFIGSLLHSSCPIHAHNINILLKHTIAIIKIHPDTSLHAHSKAQNKW